VEAKAECKLSQFLEDPIPNELNKFLPFELDAVNGLAIAVQITSFNCGGMVIGLVFDHKVSDAFSFFLFLKSWAAIARGSSDITIPQFESATLFPPETLPSSNRMEKNKVLLKRFVFNASAIVDLRAKYSTNNTKIKYPCPTRMEALSTFIWSRFLATTQQEEDPNKVYAVFHIANLRTRLDPPLSEDYFGNLSVPTVSVLPWDTEVGFDKMVVPVRDAIKQVNLNYVKILRENGGHTKFLKEKMGKLIKGEMVYLTFTSLCRFPVYDADFGWGEPIWVGSAKWLYKNLVTFLDTKSGNGIEVWINLDEEDMSKFEVDKELLAYVSSVKLST
jgi:shikimate O-hydroxycinnamoyltransferase